MNRGILSRCGNEDNLWAIGASGIIESMTSIVIERSFFTRFASEGLSENFFIINFFAYLCNKLIY